AESELFPCAPSRVANQFTDHTRLQIITRVVPALLPVLASTRRKLQQARVPFDFALQETQPSLRHPNDFRNCARLVQRVGSGQGASMRKQRVGDTITLPHAQLLKSRRPSVATLKELAVGEPQVAFQMKMPRGSGVPKGLARDFR